MVTEKATPESRVVLVNDTMQSGYRYTLAAPQGENFHEGFVPYFSPKKILELGVFEGKYCNDCHGEFPEEWFARAKICDQPNPKANLFGVKSRQSLDIWRKNGWIYGPDPRGWFQWFCRYWLGRRLPEVDAIQIRRWRSFRRHEGQVRANCSPCDYSCRPRQRQALLQWAYNPFI